MVLVLTWSSSYRYIQWCRRELEPSPQEPHIHLLQLLLVSLSKLEGTPSDLTITSKFSPNKLHKVDTIIALR